MKVPVHNPNKHPIWVGGQMVPPGETRHFEELDLPAAYRPKPPEPEPLPAAVTPEALVAELLDKTAKDVIEALAGLDDAMLGQAETAEKAGKARVTVLQAISAEILKRAGGND